MTEALERQHGLESRIGNWPADNGIALTVRDDLGHINLRGNPQDAAFTKAAVKVLGQPLPTAPNTVSEGKLTIFWLGPDEWLVLAPHADTARLVSDLESSLRGHSHALNVVSGGQLAITLDGERVRDVLARGCTLDFHPKVFGYGQCAQSGLAKTSVLIATSKSTEEMLLVVRRSFSDYLLTWLVNAS